jgi:hypothetical protein
MKECRFRAVTVLTELQGRSENKLLNDLGKTTV